MARRLRHAAHLGAAEEPGRAVLRAASEASDAGRAVAEIAAVLTARPLAFAIVFVATRYERAAVARAIATEFGAVPVIGCTTAGEIGPEGYHDGAIIGLGFPRENFAFTSRLIRPLSSYSLDDAAQIAAELLAPQGVGEAALWPHALAVLLVDGMSRAEDALVSSLTPVLGPVPLVGGSAGDRLGFGETFVYAGGAFHRDAAVLAHVRSRCPVRAFRHDHFTPTDKRMVVTGADPAERLVTEINAEPAAREYARLVGKDPEQLTPLIFAENPVVVRVGGEHYVRAIQKVEANGDLRFYSAIDEGLVLTVARAGDIVAELDAELESFGNGADPDVILGFDCVLRRLEVDQRQATRAMSEVLSRHDVYGFNTYGEQIGGMHVNQTLTGAAIYPPPAAPEPGACEVTRPGRGEDPGNG